MSARIFVDGELLRVFFPYHATTVESLRRLPTRKWNPTARCWEVPAVFLGDVESILRRDHGGVRVENDPRRGWSGSAPTNGRATSLEAAVREVYRAAPEASRAKLYRSLAAVFHPDVGGDVGVMKALNGVHREPGR